MSITPIVYTKDHDSMFYPMLDEVCERLSTPERTCKPIDMLGVMMSESGVRADAWNDNPKNLPPEKRWNASGLVQFMPFILPGVGWTGGHTAFRLLSATEQLAYVERYFKPHRGNLGSVGQIYTATFLPALIKHAENPDFVLTAKNGPLGWAYAPNASFDANRDYAITVRELEQAVLRNCKGGRWGEILERASELDNWKQIVNTLNDLKDDALDVIFDLRTTLGIQQALSRLGHDPGKLDGLPGPKTSAAVAAFQRDENLKPDGIVGPLTRTALEIALKTRA
ncbi:MAG: peptidoglycan-binding protein [Gemmatimonadota bacterium]|nr:peptidoglycan-binding protein [Gemmatimonadota bacterium]